MATRNEKEVKTRYPVDIGTTARTTKQTNQTMNLVYESSIVNENNKIGL